MRSDFVSLVNSQSDVGRSLISQRYSMDIVTSLITICFVSKYFIIFIIFIKKKNFFILFIFFNWGCKQFFWGCNACLCTLVEPGLNTWHVVCYIYVIIYISTEFAFFMRPKMIDVQYIAVFVLWTYLCKLQPRSGKRKPAQMSSCCSPLLPEAVVL